MHVNIDSCPLCGYHTSEPYLEVKDYLVSSETFNLSKCGACNFIYTNPKPSSEDLVTYYESDDYISHKSDGFNLRDLAYRMARQYMLRRKHSWLKQLVEPDSPVLDYGCGTGSFIRYLRSKQWEAYGVEPNLKARNAGNLLSTNSIFENLSTLPLSDFQIITLWHVLEHIDDLHPTFDKLVSLLRPGGFLIVAVPNCASYDATYYQEIWAGFDVPRHLYHFTPDTMNNFTSKHRLQLVSTLPLKLDAYYICMLSEKYRNGSLFNAIYQAYISNAKAKQNQNNHSSLVYIMKK